MRYLVVLAVAMRVQFASALGLAICATQLAGQCNTWQAMNHAPGVNGDVMAMAVFDPDGPGPAPTQLVIGGSFSSAAGVMAGRIVVWDPSTGVWQPLGSGMGGDVTALAVMPNGDIVAGGRFATAGGVAANGIARWNGSVWAMRRACRRGSWTLAGVVGSRPMRSIRVMAVTAAALLAACQHPPAARPFDDYGLRLRVLIGERFGFTTDSSHAVQEATGPYMLVAVGADYAEFRMDHGQVLFVSLGTLRVTVPPRRS